MIRTMGKKKKRKASGRLPTHRHVYVARVMVDEDLAPGMVALNVYRDGDTIQIAEGDEFVTIQTAVPLFRDGAPEGGRAL